MTTDKIKQNKPKEVHEYLKLTSSSDDVLTIIRVVSDKAPDGVTLYAPKILISKMYEKKDGSKVWHNINLQSDKELEDIIIAHSALSDARSHQYPNSRSTSRESISIKLPSGEVITASGGGM